MVITNSLKESSKKVKNKISPKQKHAMSQGGLGLFIYEGRRGLQVDYKIAHEHLKLSADQGIPDSQTRLAKMYLDGLGVDRSVVFKGNIMF